VTATLRLPLNRNCTVSANGRSFVFVKSPSRLLSSSQQVAALNWVRGIEASGGEVMAGAQNLQQPTHSVRIIAHG